MIAIAIPDSMLLNDDSLRLKTDKVGQIARAVSIFGVDRIYIYRDLSKNYDSDYEISRLIFQYAETPQYLRKRLIGRKRELEFVGSLPPLRIPHHLKEPTPKENEVREAVIFTQNGEKVADIGAKEMAIFHGKGQDGQRVTVKVRSLKPLSVEPSQRPEGTYWGYEVRRAPSLARFLRSVNFEHMIFTSRLGEALQEKWLDFCRGARTTKILVCFGSPEIGIDKILKQENSKLSDFKAQYLNFFPLQRTETIRLEESIFGVLSILNIASKL